MRLLILIASPLLIQPADASERNCVSAYGQTACGYDCTAAYGQMHDDDLEKFYAYLKTVPRKGEKTKSQLAFATR